MKESTSKTAIGNNLTTKSMLSRSKSPMSKRPSSAVMTKRKVTALRSPMRTSKKELDPATKAIKLENDFLKGQVAAL